ncbi:MAG TPA: AAA domain-containing protein [Chitinophagales bacterium]|nr:AAA domain-containing protein [Chitinophagales bacterium]
MRQKSKTGTKLISFIVRVESKEMIDNSVYEEIYKIHQATCSLQERYVLLRNLLEDVLKQLTREDSLQFPDLYSRLTAVCEKFQLSKSETNAIHQMRKNAHLILIEKMTPTYPMYLRDIKTLSQTFSRLLQLPIPTEYSLLIDEAIPTLVQEPENEEVIYQKEKFSLIRFYVLEVHPTHFVGSSEELPLTSYQVNFDLEDTFFKESILLTKAGNVIHLIDAEVLQGEISFQMLITEPDYLIDISSIAECNKDYGVHPYFYYISRLSQKMTTTPILLGNMANHFLDVFVNAPIDQDISYKATMQEIFRMFPFDISINSELDDEIKKIQFFKNSQLQFNNIKRVVRNVFPKQDIDIQNAVLEPSFICPQLGIQGRLDFLSITNKGTTVIELKSGKAPFPESRTELVAVNHKSQLFLYQIVVQKVLGIKFKDLHSYLFYSKYEDADSNLRRVQPYMDGIKQILNIRNQIAGIERKVVEDENYFARIIQHLTPDLIVNVTGQNEKFIQNYIYPQIQQFKNIFKKATPLELSYFYNFYHFITKEQFISKAGLNYYNQTLGHSALWLGDINEKLESGNILYQLSILENFSDQTSPTIKLKIPTYNEYFLPNFRLGDIVILYEKNQDSDNVTNQHIFRGSIVQIQHDEVTIRLRYTQNNLQLLPLSSQYALEKDYLDTSFGSMYRGLFSFLSANEDRRKLILNERALEIDTSIQLNEKVELSEIENIVLKAKQAKDYFILVGPPGTGKTSIALKSMVKEFYSDSTTNILLLSYTNRAVDEICASISQIDPAIDFIRIGSEYSSEKRFHHRLLQNVIQPCTKREEVKEVLMKHRVYVATVASLSGKLELLQLKQFQVAIIDEASQILEPQLIGILSAKHQSNQNAIEKFILIGDQKQLPAIVVQSPASSIVKDSVLIQAGITDRRISLFERLFRYHENNPSSDHWSMLTKQGRMHPDIAQFINHEFYNGLLQTVPVHHQEQTIYWAKYDSNHFLQNIIATQRLAFLSSTQHPNDKSFKKNTYEATLAVQLLLNIYEMYALNEKVFDPNYSVGIITPYRSQIALIRHLVHQLGIPELEKITIDTVERYQGSQRDFIIYSFCVNHAQQLDLLSNIYVENNKNIDRKLNVALTRAREQMYIIGNPYFLEKNIIFNQLITQLKTNSSFIAFEELSEKGIWRELVEIKED